MVEKGMADADILLPTYESERRGIAEELLKFDTEYATLFSGRSPDATQLTADEGKAKGAGAVDAQRFIETFKKVGSSIDLCSIKRVAELGFDPECFLHFRMWSSLPSQHPQRSPRFRPRQSLPQRFQSRRLEADRRTTSPSWKVDSSSRCQPYSYSTRSQNERCFPHTYLRW